MNNNNIDIEKLKQYINDLDEQIVPLTKKTVPKEPKVKKPISDLKREQLIKARVVVNANHQTRIKQKKLEYAKILLEDEISKPKPVLPIITKAKKQIIAQESETEPEPEIIYIKKHKKKPKKIIIQDDDSSSSGSEEPDIMPVKIPVKSFGKSHRNAKSSVIKVHDKTFQNPQPFNYFCD